MRHRWGRWVLVVAAIAVSAGAGLWAFRTEGELQLVRQAAITAATHAGSARAALGDVRRALAAMAAPGQAAAGWSRRATASIDEVRSRVTALGGAVPPSAVPHAAGDVLERLSEAERRLRDHAVGGKPLMAADVAFAEAMPHVEELERLIAETVTTATASNDRQVATLRDRQAAALAAALLAPLVAMLLLAPLPRPDAADSGAEPIADGAATSGPLPDLPVLISSDRERGPAPTIDLQSLADVCGELASVADAAALPAVLQRVAAAVGARGTILWLADEGGRRLRIAGTAGYDQRLVDRLGPVAVDDDNPTSHAFVTRQPVGTDARDGHAASVAVPITGAGAVCGVLSAELVATDGGAVADATAAMRVVAAQLALLVPPGIDAAPSDVRAHGTP